jgi:iron complex outermembrane receptor protein
MPARSRLFVFLLAVVCHLPALLMGQGCTLSITGGVYDEHDRTPLPYSTIVIVETGKGTLADDSGQYVLSNLCPGRYTLYVSHVGCDPITQIVHLTRDTLIDFYTEHHVELLQTVTKSAYRISEAPAQTRRDLSGEELAKLQGRSLAEMLSSVTGVTMVQTGPGIAKPMIHGLFGNRVLIVQYNVRQEGQQWGIDHAPEIDPAVAGRISVIKGAEGIRYGPDALGGVIEISPEPLPRSPGIGGTVFTSYQHNGRGGKVSASMQGGLRAEGWGWRTTASYSRFGDRQAPDYLLANTATGELGLSAQVGYTGNKSAYDFYYSMYQADLGILRAAHIGNLTDLNAAIQSGEPWFQRPFSYELITPRQQVMHHLARAEAIWQRSPLWDIKARFSFQWDDRKEFDTRRGDRSRMPALDMTILSQQFELLAEHRMYKHFKGTIGSSVQYQNNYNNPGTGTVPLIPNYVNLTASVFAIERYIRDRYELEAGLRFDYRYVDALYYTRQGERKEPELHFANLSASLGGRYRFNPTWTGIFQLGSAFRPPGMNELYSQGLHHGTAAIEEGDPNLTVEQGWKMVLTSRHEYARTTVDVSAYAHYLRGFIYLRPEDELVLTIRGAFPLFRYRQTDAMLYGADFSLVQHLWSGLYYRGNASLLLAEDLRETGYLFGMPAQRFTHELMWNASLDAKGRQNLECRLGVLHVLRQFRAPDFDFAPPPDGYYLLFASLTASYGHTMLTLGVDNLLNVRYRDYLDRLRYFADARGRNVFVKLHTTF